MKKRTLRYTSLLLLISSLLLSFSLAAQNPPGKKIMKSDLEKKEQTPFYNGTTLGVDIFGIGNKLFGGDYLSSEISLDVNVKNKFFPVVEIGYGSTNATSDVNNITYKSSAPYARIGIDYNTMSKNKSASFLYVGLRYGFSAFSYSIKAPEITDGIWQGGASYNYPDQKSNMQWLEVVLGVKAQIYKKFQMGWALRYKSRLSIKDSPNSTPGYVPGFGSNNSSTFGVTYSLIYKLPF